MTVRIPHFAHPFRLVRGRALQNLCTDPLCTGTGWEAKGAGTTLGAVTLGDGKAPEPSLGVLALGNFNAQHLVGDSVLDRGVTTIPVEEGKTYHASAWVYLVEGEDGVAIGSFDPGGGFKTYGAIPPIGEWRRIELSFAPDSTGNWTVGPMFGPSGGVAYFTDVLVREADSLGFFFPTAQQIEAGLAEWDGIEGQSTATYWAPGKAAVVDQDSQEEVATNVAAILATREGSRIEEPEFGIPDALFELLPPDPRVDDVLAAVEEWEPRAKVLAEVEIEDLTKRVTVELARTGE